MMTLIIIFHMNNAINWGTSGGPIFHISTRSWADLQGKHEGKGFLGEGMRFLNEGWFLHHGGIMNGDTKQQLFFGDFAHEFEDSTCQEVGPSTSEFDFHLSNC